MKRRFILFAVVFTALICSCDKEETYLPAPISGDWAFSAANTGTEWKSLPVSNVLAFDGSGAYTIKTLKSGLSAIYLQDGVLDMEADSFEQTNSKAYTAEFSLKKYRFSSVKGDFELVESGETEMVFDFVSDNTAIRGYKLSKITAYKVPSEPETPIDPDKPAINGTDLVEGNDLVGLVSDASTGKGIPGVTVSDGYDCVATDENGVYQFKSNTLTRLVYISTPAEYKIPVGSAPSRPLFYKEIKPSGERIRSDFQLSPLSGGKETQWIFIGIGDPQCATAANSSRYSNETIPDIKKTMSGKSSVYAMTLGDIVFDSTDMWPAMKSSMASVTNGSWFIPFFQTIGNHDHDSLKPNTADDLMDDYNATSTFVSVCGPTDYSFNRGDVHVISMDDIPVASKNSSSKSNKYTWTYGKGFTDAQYEWLKKDLALVKDKNQKMVFICCHIPFRNAANSAFGHSQDVLKQLAEFKEAHIMIGHTHYTQNYVYTNYKAKGGLYLYEHIHGSACGAWWTTTCSSTVTGEPSGYTWYEIDGAHIKDWHFKGTNKTQDYQLRVFDGNEIYYENGTYPLNWYTASQKVGTYSFTVKGNASLKNSFVAQVFNDDDVFWSVEMRKKSTGEKIGSFTRLANKASTNIAMSAYYYNKKSKSSDSYCSVTASHYWYYRPSSGVPANEKDWEVVAIQKIPGGEVTHEYKCSTLSTEATLAKDFYY